jgi:hypothetical protein
VRRTSFASTHRLRGTGAGLTAEAPTATTARAMHPFLAMHLSTRREASPRASSDGAAFPVWWRTWGGPAVSAIPVLVILMDGAMKVVGMAPELSTWQARTGLPASLMVPLGLLELVCVAVYVVPRTAVLGAVLLTGILGGGLPGQLRVGGPAALGALVLAALLWGALFLRDERVRALLPFVKDPQS